jgi:hypothetical protein
MIEFIAGIFVGLGLGAATILIIWGNSEANRINGRRE